MKNSKARFIVKVLFENITSIEVDYGTDSTDCIFNKSKGKKSLQK